MSNLRMADDVRSLSHSFMDDSKHVWIYPEGCKVLAEKILESQFLKNRAPWGYPKCIDISSPRALNNLFLFELIGGSVNYCYW